MIDTKGYLNNKHRTWSFDNIKPCLTCTTKNKNDAILEMFLRFKINYLLKIENDNFTQKFREYKGIEFIFKIPYKNNNNNIINYIIEQKSILGVGFRIINNNSLFNENINFQTSFNFIIPILAFGKMWEIIFNQIDKSRKIIIIDETLWNSFKYKSISNLCLFCDNFPLGIYPGNFIVNQNILYMRGFIWMDKKRFHVQKSTNKIIAYNDNSVIVTWPFLKYHIKSKCVNHLGNMVCFTSGDIFSNYIDAIIKKIYKISLQNEFIIKIKYNSSKINTEDLKLMYKYCRRKKTYCVKNFIKLPSSENDEQENCIISAINNNNNDDDDVSHLLNWFKYPKSKTNLAIIIQEMSQMIKRGEIDSAITQTSILSKDYNVADNNIFNKINLDVHRIGRFTRNVATNDFWNICAIGNGVQKVLPKDTKTKEPKKITKSEIGFLDLINTPDTPRHCGLILESVLDVIVSTHSMTCPSLEEAFTTLYPNNFHRIDDVTKVESPYVYVCANLELFRFKPTIPIADYLKPHHYIYLAKQYGIENYFRMIQYALKIKYPCIELVKESNQFWICTSQPRTFYKIHTDGLLYTSREMEYFEKDIMSSLWIGAEMRSYIHNIFGPSVRGTPRPNTCHLPRISHACSSSWKHAVGIPSNTGQQTAAIHQKNVTISYYCLKLDSSDNIILPGFSCLVLVMSGFNNQEDGITVRKSVIDRGMFLATSYETATVRINYSIFQSCNIKFISTIRKNQILRKGLQIGYFRNRLATEKEEEEKKEEEEEEEEMESNNKFSKDKLIDVFSSELKLLRRDLTTGGIGLPLDNNNNNNILEKNECLAVVWLGKNNNEIIKCHDIKCHDIKCMKNLKMYLTYYSQFTPTVGDKLQTSTSQKGVITQLLSDEDTPFILTKEGNIYPEIIINPQYLKRQTFDTIFNAGQMLSRSKKYNNNNNNNNPYLENCFSYEIGNSIYYMQLGSKEFTGRVINPITGYPYMRPTTTTTNKIYKKPFYEYLGEDGFTYIANKIDYDDNYEIIDGSIYIGHYFNVCNHRATHMMQSSKCDDNIIRTEFSGAPIRGKKGGFSTGPQEQLALTGMGMTRFIREVGLLRSDYCNVPLKSKEEEEEIFGGSTTFKRMHDDLDMRGLDVTYKIKKLGE